jgi:hypothetical protein
MWDKKFKKESFWEKERDWFINPVYVVLGLAIFGEILLIMYVTGCFK